jgi:hypothetical protein
MTIAAIMAMIQLRRRNQDVNRRGIEGPMEGGRRFDHKSKIAAQREMSANSYAKTSATRAVSGAPFFYHTLSAERFK